MNGEPPASAEIVAAVARFLREEAMPALSGRAAFDARVAANALDLVEREFRLGGAAGARADAELDALLGPGGEGDRTVELCERIDAGALDEAAALETLWTIGLDKLRIDQPAYSRLRQAEAAAPNRTPPHPED